MNLLIRLIRAVAAAQEAHVVQASVFFHLRHRAGDDVDVVADGKFHEAVTDFGGVLRQSADCLRLAVVVEPRHQRSVEVFRKQHKVALIARHRVDEKLHLFEKVVDSAV